jgi:hypothetical protein
MNFEMLIAKVAVSSDKEPIEGATAIRRTLRGLKMERLPGVGG